MGNNVTFEHSLRTMWRMKKISTKTSTMFIDEHGIFHKIVIENCHVDLEALKESDRITEELTEGTKVLMLYDARPHFTITEDAMEYAQKDIFNKKRMAVAMISDKIAIRIMVDYITKTMKSDIPIKVFNTTEEAMEWLLTFKAAEDNNLSATDHLTRFSSK